MRVPVPRERRVPTFADADRQHLGAGRRGGVHGRRDAHDADDDGHGHGDDGRAAAHRAAHAHRLRSQGAPPRSRWHLARAPAGVLVLLLMLGIPPTCPDAYRQACGLWPYAQCFSRLASAWCQFFHTQRKVVTKPWIGGLHEATRGAVRARAWPAGRAGGGRQVRHGHGRHAHGHPRRARAGRAGAVAGAEDDRGQADRQRAHVHGGHRAAASRAGARALLRARARRACGMRLRGAVRGAMPTRLRGWGKRGRCQVRGTCKAPSATLCPCASRHFVEARSAPPSWAPQSCLAARSRACCAAAAVARRHRAPKQCGIGWTLSRAKATQLLALTLTDTDKLRRGGGHARQVVKTLVEHYHM